jgi:hypothetical protein
VKPAAVRLAVCAALFVGWLGYLTYLVAATRNSVVLSRPQLLDSEEVVVGTVDQLGDKGQGTVTVNEVLFGPGNVKALEGKQITVWDLKSSATPDGGKWMPGGVESGHQYFLPLQPDPSAHPDATAEPPRFRVTPLPASPGFGGGAARVYSADPEVLRQYQRIPK